MLFVEVNADLRKGFLGVFQTVSSLDHFVAVSFARVAVAVLIDGVLIHL